MNLYYWSSCYLQQYSKGFIVVAAISVEEAREKAIADFSRHIKEERYYVDEEIEEEIEEENRQKFLKDISTEPTTTDVLWINGSE